jgi:hypothetical protein
MDTACTAFRATWLENALAACSPGFAADPAQGAHRAACTACARWSARRTDQIAALRGVTRRSAPNHLAKAIAMALVPGGSGAGSSFETRLARRLTALPQHRAPAVLARLVGEELAAPGHARVRRFAGDLDRPAVPGVLAQRVSVGVASDAARGRGPRPLLSAAAAAAVLLAIGLFFVGGRPEAGRPFTVRQGSPPVPSPLAASLADGWAGGILAAGETAGESLGRPIREEGR